MKQTTTVMMMALACYGQAQVLNSGFESLNASGSIRNWGMTTPISQTIDLNGNTDSLVVDQQLYFSTTDAHTGQRALEMRNAYFYNSGEQIAGSASLSTNDSVYDAHAALPPLSGQPTHFTFYYKFFPVSNDVAYGWMSLLDSGGVEIGRADITITAASGSYVQASAPITYTGAGPVAFVQSGFSTASPGTVPHYGTRFLVDDVNAVVTGIAEAHKDAALRCYPNPATSALMIDLDDALQARPELHVTDAQGRDLGPLNYTSTAKGLSIDVQALPAGVYSIMLRDSHHSYTGRFVKLP